MEWDEEKHPRDEKGRFTDGKASELLKDKEYLDSLTADELKALILEERAPARIPLNYFGNGRNIKLSEEELRAVAAACPREAYGFLDKERLHTSHHTRHREEMGYKNQSDYQQAAVDFWNRGNGKFYYTPYRKLYYKYNGKTKEFVSVGKDGIVHTFMPMSNKIFEKLVVEESLYEIEV